MQSSLITHKENILFATFCLGGLLILILFGYIPLHHQATELQAKIGQLNLKTQEQQQIASLLTLVDRKLANSRQNILPDFKAADLPMSKSANILTDMAKIAKESNLELAAITPELGDKKEDWHNLGVKVALYGKFPNLRKFIMHLLTLPYITDIDRIEIKSTNVTNSKAVNQLLFNLKFKVRLN